MYYQYSKNIFFQEYVCGIKNIPCSWGRAINVANRYVYVSQPQKDRVLVISETQMVIVDVSKRYPNFLMLYSEKLTLFIRWCQRIKILSNFGTYLP